jgi:hypothetical protein
VPSNRLFRRRISRATGSLPAAQGFAATKHLLPLLLLSVVSSICTVANAQPALNPCTLNQAVDTPVTSSTLISCGALTFSNFQVANGVVDILAGSDYDPLTGEAYLYFNPNLGGQNSQSEQLLFQVTGGISQFDVLVSGKNATITEVACATIPTGSPLACTDTIVSLVDVPSNFQMSSPVFTSTSPVYILDTIATPEGGSSNQLTLSFLPLTITTTSVPNGVENLTYPSITLQAQDGTIPYTWSVSAGALPAGMTLSSTGLLSGTPTAFGPFTFTAQVTDSTYPTPLIAAQQYNFTVVQPLTITTLAVPNGVQNVPYTATQLAATGGTQPYTWSVSAGALPAGMTLSSTGVLSGTPTAFGPFTFTAQVTDSTTPTPLTAAQQYNFTVVQALTITTLAVPNGVQNVPYASTQLAATGGTMPYTWSVSLGALPAGMTLSSTGLLSGTPTAFGPFTFTAKVTDSTYPTPLTAAQQYNFTVVQALTITTLAVPNGVQNVPYTATQLAATGGTMPYTWSVSLGALPAGMTLSSTGLLSGTPTAFGPFTFTAKVTDSTTPTALTATQQYNFTVVQPLSITTLAVPNGVQNVPYTATQLAATGGTTPYTWSVSAGALPAGMTLSSTGLLSGTPTAFGPFTFTAKVTDSTYPTPLTATEQYNFTVVQPLSISTLAVPNGVQNVPYTATQLAATGGTMPYTWSVTAGALPAGMTLSSTGLLSGTPTAFGPFTFTAKVTDSTYPTPLTATQQYNFTVVQPLSITTLAVPNGVQNVPYASTQLAATGGTTPYTWSVSLGALPAGMTLSSAGVLSGTPTAFGPFTFTAKVTDSTTPTALTATQAYSGTIEPSLAITTPSPLASGAVGVSYSQTLTASGGKPPYTWSLAPSPAPVNLPAGLSLNSAVGQISGVPTAAGNSIFSVQVTDSQGLIATKSFSLSINAALVITTSSPLPAGTVSAKYSQTLQAVGGSVPYTWTLSGGALPAGLSLNPATGIIGGTPNASGAANFNIQVADSNRAVATAFFALTINAAPALASATLPSCTVGVNCPQTVTLIGGTAPFTYAVSVGALPAGLSLNPATGQIGGKPTAPTANGFASFTIQVTDSNGATASQQYKLTVNPAPAITTTSPLTGGTVNANYTLTLQVSGGTPPFTWTVVGTGALPAGLSLSAATGQIGGKPTVGGTANFTVEVTDANGAAASAPFTLTIAPALAITSTLTGCTLGAACSQAVSVTGGTAPYTYKVSAGVLPAGLSLNSSTGQITGTPTANGVSSFTIQVTDSNGTTASQQFTLTVSLPPLTLTVQAPSSTALPSQQLPITLTLPQTYPVDLAGECGLQFTPNSAAPVVDPTIQFNTGGDTVPFQIPAGQTSGVFPLSPLEMQTGTVAGSIVLTCNATAGGVPVTLSNSPGFTVNLAQEPPVIIPTPPADGYIQQVSGGFSVVVTGYSNTREITQANFTFTPVSGSQLQASTFSLTNVAAVFQSYYASDASTAYGSQFTYAQPFTITAGSMSALQSVTVTLTNSQGVSSALTVPISGPQ